MPSHTPEPDAAAVILTPPAGVRRPLAAAHSIGARLLAAVLLCVTIPLLPVGDSIAFGHANDAKPMRFTHYDRDDGLSQSAVNQIVQDSTGFMWFATESGLNRFDGYSFNVFRHIRGDVESLPNDFITDMGMDAAGDLWLATDGGGLVLHRRNQQSFSTFRHDPDSADSIPDNHLRRVLVDPAGAVWAGSMRHGLSRLDTNTGTIRNYRHDPNKPESLSDDRIYALWRDADGTLWIGTGAGLDRLTPADGKIARFSIGDADTGADNRVLAIRRDHHGTLWIGTARHGLVRLDEATGTLMPAADGTSTPQLSGNERVEVIYEDSASRLWVGTSNGLLLVDSDGQLAGRYLHDRAEPSSLSDSYVISIVEDRTGVLWIGTKTGGISKWNSRSWLLGHLKPQFDAGPDAGNPRITSFTRDASGHLWVGTFGSGIDVLDPNFRTVRRLRHSPGASNSLSENVVMALLTDAQGYIWAGTMHGGLNRIDPVSGDVFVYRHDPDDDRSLAADGIMSLYAARDGSIWVGTFGGGVSRYDPARDSFINFRHDPADPSSLSNPNVTAIVEDASGTIWVGTSGGGLNRMNTEGAGWTRYLHAPDDANSLTDNAVYSLHVDGRGHLWAGTRSGLNRFVPTGAGGPGLFTSLTQADGLADNVIYGVHSDADGRLWLSTNYGISRLAPATLKIRNFYVSDGLQGEEFNFGAHYAGEDGRLYFGGNNGFNVFDPADLEFAAEPPKVVVTGFAKFNEAVDSGVAYEALDDVELGYTDDMVSFEFAALDYIAPARNQYAYRLEGFDRDWVQAGNKRLATYTDLPGGQYVFRVKAANSDGVWSEADVAVAIAVDHPPWLTPWAFALYALGFIAAIYFAYRVQARKLVREAEYSRRLETEVRDRTSDLAKSNSELTDANQKLRDASMTDALTGLRNRRYLFEEITKDVELVRRNHDPRQDESVDRRDMVFFVVDLDHFKPINDSCGHQAGDRVLLKVKDILQNACRSSDIVIRWGGDEFLIVGRQSTHDHANILAERVRANIANTTFEIGNGQTARTTASIGFASYPFLKHKPELLTWEQVLGVADMAMYIAKDERNAWAGLHGVHWSRSGDSLVQALQLDLEGVAKDGWVRIEKSLSLSDSKTA